MCDPFSLAVASTVIGGVGTAGGMIGQRNAQEKQQKAVGQWRVEQDRFREAERVRQEAMRRDADAARQTALDKISGEGQKETVANETARLNDALLEQVGPGGDLSVADAQLSGQDSSVVSSDFKTDMAKKIAEASKGVKERIKSLAGLSAYGGSSGGLGTVNPIAMQTAGSNIDVANDLRRGSLGVYNLEANERPAQVEYNPSFFNQIAPTLLSLGAQGLGGSLFGAGGGAAGGGINTAALAPKVVDPWAGIRFASTPATMKPPVFNSF